MQAHRRGALAGALILAGALALSGALGACASMARSDDGAAEAQPHATLVIEVEPAAARVFIDDEPRGEVERWRGQSLPVSAGARRLELRHGGYYAYRADLTLEAQRTYTLRVRMVRRYD